MFFCKLSDGGEGNGIVNFQYYKDNNITGIFSRICLDKMTLSDRNAFLNETTYYMKSLPTTLMMQAKPLKQVLW